MEIKEIIRVENEDQALVILKRKDMWQLKEMDGAFELAHLDKNSGSYSWCDVLTLYVESFSEALTLAKLLISEMEDVAEVSQ